MKKVLKVDPSTLGQFQTWSVGRLRLGESWGGSYDVVDKSTASELQARWEIALHEAIRKRGAVESNDESDMQLGYTIVVSDDGDTPQPIQSNFFWKEGVKHQNFDALVAAGHILVSNYEVGRILATSYPSSFSDRKTRVGSRGFYLEQFLSVPGFQSSRFFITEDLFLLSSGVRWVSGDYYRYDVSYLPPLPVDASGIASSLRAMRLEKPIVAAALGDINKGTVDALTALAEMPETIRSCINGIRMVADLMSSTKKREISLTKAFDRRKDNLRQAYLRDVEMIRHKKWIKPHLMSRALNRRRRTYNKAVKNSAIEFNSALADIWLNFRYNIMPNVYLIEDILETIQSSGIYVSSSEGEPFDFDLSLGSHIVTVQGNRRCRIKRRLKDSGNIKQTISANLIVTAWELVPLSFVVDWFINIGDVLSSISFYASVLEEGATWAQRIPCEIDTTNDSGQRVVVSGYSYSRWVINPSDLTGICFQYKMNADRYTDALALSWAGIRHNLRKL